MATGITKKTATPSDNLYVVGIGASAGGLEAINELFDNLAGNTNFSFVIIQHLSPDHKSLMSELLSKHTSMKVLEAENNVLLSPNCVYLLPPKKIMTLKHGRIRLEEKLKSNVPNNAIDIFFDSLATDKGEKAIGIILSGTGTDGSKGIARIKEKGGTVVVQDPLTAEFDGMPNSAVATGTADLILPPEIMADELVEYLKESPFSKAFNSLSRQEEAILADIMEQVHKVTGHDFSHYKRPTINRRLTKRMTELGFESLGEYYNQLRRDPGEATTLSKEFLINVTKFFRDEEAFGLLQKKVIPLLISDQKKNEQLIKVWSVACSTGEEAYSIAMLFYEHIQANNRYETEIKIFATDIHQESIDFASKGLYPSASLKDMSEERCQRFFTKEGDNYRISPAIRKMVVFAKQDILQDPPFSKIDLLVCRNMLIYMTPLLQKNVLKKFHFAINEGGYLFLGPSENIGMLKESMKEVDKKWKLYQCVAKPRPGDHDTFLNPGERSAINTDLSTKVRSKNALANISDIFRETLLEEHNYAGLYVDKDFDVKQAIGNFKNFIDFPEGNFNFNLLRLVPTDLSVVLSTAIRKAINENKKVTLKKVRVSHNGGERFINIIIKPFLTQKTYTQPFIFIVLSEDIEEQRRTYTLTENETNEHLGQRLLEMEDELRNTKENLQAVIEEVESANEELQSSNEEIVSSNEELQSTNEELQSLNEELHTVNAEHQLKIKELIELNDDMNNYFRNTEVGQILLDRRMVIKKFTPVATRQVNLIDSDVGRSITDISTNFTNLDFIADIKTVMKSGQALEKEARSTTNNIYLMRIAPYLRQDKVLDGVVISFINVTESRKLNSLVEAIFNSSTSAITALRPVFDKKKKITDFEFTSANETVQNILGFSSTGIVGRKWNKDFADFLAPHFHNLLAATSGETMVKFDCYNPRNKMWIEVSAVHMMEGIVITFTDITQAKRAYQELEKASSQLNESNAQLEQSNFDLLQFASVASHDLKEPLRKIQTFGNILKDNVRAQLDPKDATYLDKIIRSANRMQVLIQDILTLSKLSNNDIPYLKVDIQEIIDNIVDDLYVSIREKNVTVKTENLPEIEAIPGQIHQLFQNLISNSIKFNNSEAPVITIEHKAVCDEDAKLFNIDPAAYACIELADNGIGFDEQYKDKIFGIFQRLAPSEYEGTGIGLAICKKIIDNHDGFIKAGSQPGKGARFTIFLPIRKKTRQGEQTKK